MPEEVVHIPSYFEMELGRELGRRSLPRLGSRLFTGASLNMGSTGRVGDSKF